MNTFKLIISSPDGNIFDGEVFKFDVRGTEGELAVMAGHIPFVSAVVPCDCSIELADETIRKAKCDGGLLTVAADKTTFFSGTFKFDE
jgi:F-type H+-transporting ATPase subunit epsilon